MEIDPSVSVGLDGEVDGGNSPVYDYEEVTALSNSQALQPDPDPVPDDDGPPPLQPSSPSYASMSASEILALQPSPIDMDVPPLDTSSSSSPSSTSAATHNSSTHSDTHVHAHAEPIQVNDNHDTSMNGHVHPSSAPTLTVSSASTSISTSSSPASTSSTSASSASAPSAFFALSQAQRNLDAPASKKRKSFGSTSTSNRRSSGGSAGPQQSTLLASKRPVRKASASASNALTLLNAPATGSRFVECPICGKQVYANDINSHLDSECTGSNDTDTTPTSSTSAKLTSVSPISSSSSVSTDSPTIPASSTSTSACIAPASITPSLSSTIPSTPASSQRSPSMFLAPSSTTALSTTKRTRTTSTKKSTPTSTNPAEALFDAVNGSGLTECPFCGKSVLTASINIHIDLECENNEQSKASVKRRAISPSSISTTSSASADVPASVLTSSSSSTSSTPSTLPPLPPTSPSSVTSSSMPAEPSSASPSSSPTESAAVSDPSSSSASSSFISSSTSPRKPMSSSPPSSPSAQNGTAISPSDPSLPFIPSSTTAPSALHPLFTGGAKPASAFVARRRGKLDKIRPDHIEHLHVDLLRVGDIDSSSPSTDTAFTTIAMIPHISLTDTTTPNPFTSPPTNSSPYFQWSVQWTSHIVASKSSSAASTSSELSATPTSSASDAPPLSQSASNPASLSSIHLALDSAHYSFRSSMKMTTHTESTKPIAAAASNKTRYLPSGDLFSSNMHALINTVNCVGVMGKGIALAFKQKYLAMFADYQQRCQRGQVKIGEPYLYRVNDQQVIINFPTKQHWRNPSKMEYIQSGLQYLTTHLHEWGVTSLAIPPLGCGNGGLDWNVVRPLIIQYLSPLGIDMEIYGQPPADQAHEQPNHIPTSQADDDGVLTAGCAEMYFTSSMATEKLSPRFDVKSQLLRANQTPKRFNFTPSVLKSLLQKNIRLSRPVQAVRVALQLIIHSSFLDFIRRLTIIIVEDCVLHPLFPYLIFLTFACSRTQPIYHVTVIDVNTCLQVVADIAAVGIKDRLVVVKEAKAPKHDDGSSSDEHVSSSGGRTKWSVDVSSELPDLTPIQRLYVKSLLIRAHLGGMKGDVWMLKTFANLWVKRFRTENQFAKQQQQQQQTLAQTNGSSAPSSTSSSSGPRIWLTFLQSLYEAARKRCLPALLQAQQLPSDTNPTDGTSLSPCFSHIDVFRIGPLDGDDLVLSAIDFHCSPMFDLLMGEKSSVRHIIKDNIQRLFGDQADVDSLLRDMIWEFRSSLTNKVWITGGTKNTNYAPDSPFGKLKQLFQLISTAIDDASRKYIEWRMIPPTAASSTFIPASQTRT